MMSINGPIEKRENAFNIVLNTHRINDGPVGDFCPFNESILNRSYALETSEVSIRATVGVSVS